MVNIKDSAPESEEQKFKQKCNELRKRIAEVEESNEISTLALSRTRYAIRRLRLEYSILLERLESRLPAKESGDLHGPYESEIRKPVMLNEDLETRFQSVEKYKFSLKEKNFASSESVQGETKDPKRHTNAYLIFCEREGENVRAEFESKNPGQPIEDFQKFLAKIWQGMDEKERMPYCKLSLEDKGGYQSEMTTHGDKKRNFEEADIENTCTGLDKHHKSAINSENSPEGGYADGVKSLKTTSEGMAGNIKEATKNSGEIENNLGKHGECQDNGESIKHDGPGNHLESNEIQEYMFDQTISKTQEQKTGIPSQDGMSDLGTV